MNDDESDHARSVQPKRVRGRREGSGGGAASGAPIDVPPHGGRRRVGTSMGAPLAAPPPLPSLRPLTLLGCTLLAWSLSSAFIAHCPLSDGRGCFRIVVAPGPHPREDLDE